MRKKPRTGLMIVVAALGAGTVGFLLGRFGAPPAPAPRPAAPAARAPADLYWEEPVDPYAADPAEAEAEGPGEAEAAAASGAAAEVQGLPPSELVDVLKKHAASPQSQQILVGMIADAARAGGPALADVKRLLDSGVDIEFKSFRGKPGEFPTFRTALLAAAEATGDPAAAEMIAEVARTSESPVEVVYSAHLLDRLDALDAQTAQRTLDSIAAPLSPDERKAMGSIVGRVVPAAARADPAYAEQLLLTQLHAPEGTPANARYLVPVLDGLGADRARDLVLGAITSQSVDVKFQRALAGRVAQRKELGLLTDLRHAIESNTIAPKVVSSIAHSAISSRSYSRFARNARNALRKGNIAQARRVAEQFHARLLEATRTVDAARNTGAKVNKKVDTIARLHEQTLDDVRAAIRRAIDRQRNKQRKQQQQAAKAAR